MAQYPLPRVLEEIFNIQNFVNTSYNTSYAEYAQITLSNTFQSINTFLSNVYIKATLFATNLNVSNINVTNTILGYNISTFAGIKAPIQAQFDSIIDSGNLIQLSTVSVAETITVSSEIPASVENIGTNINANLKFSIPQGSNVTPSTTVGSNTFTAPAYTTGYRYFRLIGQQIGTGGSLTRMGVALGIQGDYKG